MGAVVFTYIHLDATAASIILVTLLPLAAVPTLIRSSLSIRASDETALSNEEANHVHNYVDYVCLYLLSLHIFYL